MARQVRETANDQGGFWATVTSQRSATAFVWAAWIIFLLTDLVVLAKFGRNIPISEDWWLVAPLTGNEPSLVSWLWAQNNEHRIPFPRLILLGLLKLGGGDWRTGAVFSIVLLGILAAALILVARKLRKGRSIFADAIFPLALLSIGNWENIFWSWQLTQVVTIALTCILLLLIVTIEEKIRPMAMLAAGTVLILLPLSGANGLLWLPLNLPFFAYYGFRCWRGAPKGSNSRWAAAFLLGAVLLSAIIAGLYLLQYRQPDWVPPNPGILPSFYAVLQLLALTIGPVARSAWLPAIAITMLILVPAVIILARSAIRYLGSKEEMRIVGLLAFFGNAVLFSMALGYGRAGVVGIIPGWSTWPIRYAHFGAPLLFTVYFVWLLYFPRRVARTASTALALLLFLLLPLNAIHGYEWHYWASLQDDNIMEQIDAGAPTDAIAGQFRENLWSWAGPGELEKNLRWLKETGIPPFDGAFSNLAVQEIHYYQPAAIAVDLVWGVDGWSSIDEELWPAGTMIKQNLMYTPLQKEGNSFNSSLQVPPGTTVDFGFLFSIPQGDNPVEPFWEGNGQEDFHILVEDNGKIDIRSSLVLDENGQLNMKESVPLVENRFLYERPDLEMVTLVWGIDGWQPPSGTVDLAGSYLQDGLVHTPMQRLEDGRFAATINLPAQSEIDCGFLVTNTLNSNGSTPLWDDLCHAGTGSTKEANFTYDEPIHWIEPPVVEETGSWPMVELRYQLPQAKEVFTYWGIDGWQPLPEKLQPEGTVIEDKLMKTPLTREAEAFVLQVQIPPGSSLQYGFRSKTRLSGLLLPDFLNWDFSHDEFFVEGEDVVLTVVPDTKLQLQRWPALILATGGLFILIWAVLALLHPGNKAEDNTMVRTSAPTRSLISFLPNLYRRDLLRELVARDLKLRYRRSVLGIAWSLLNPLLQLLVLTFVFSFILPLEIENYSLFMFIGLLAWIWLSSSLTAATTSIVDNRSLIRRPGFPAGVLPVVSVTSNLIHFLLSLPVVFLMLLLLGLGIKLTILLLPAIIILQFIFTLSISVFLAVFQVTFRDTHHLVSVFLFLWFYLTPIFYNVALIPEQYRVIYALNPMVHIVVAYRAVLMYGEWPQIMPLMIIGALSILVLFVGHRLLQRASDRFVEEL
jgi:lipopolysaccharide transport system permease protein